VRGDRGLGDGDVLLRRASRYPDRAQALAVDDHRYAAFHRQVVLELQQRRICPRALGEHARRRAQQRGGPRLLPGHLRGQQPGAVHAQQGKGKARVVADRDRDPALLRGGFRQGGLDERACIVLIEHRTLYQDGPPWRKITGQGILI
jgi:hypothetical protein